MQSIVLGYACASKALPIRLRTKCHASVLEYVGECALRKARHRNRRTLPRASCVCFLGALQPPDILRGLVTTATVSAVWSRPFRASANGLQTSCSGACCCSLPRAEVPPGSRHSLMSFLHVVPSAPFTAHRVFSGWARYPHIVPSLSL